MGTERIYGRNLVCENKFCSTNTQIRLTTRKMTDAERKRREKQLEGHFREVLELHPMSDPPKRLTKAVYEGETFWLCDNCIAKLRIRPEPTKAEIREENENLVAEYFARGRTVKRV